MEIALPRYTLNLVESGVKNQISPALPPPLVTGDNSIH
jgi:hypothetical protein